MLFVHQSTVNVLSRQLLVRRDLLENARLLSTLKITQGKATTAHDYLANCHYDVQYCCQKCQRKIAVKGLVSDWWKWVVPKKSKTVESDLIPSVPQLASSSWTSLTFFGSPNEHEGSDDGLAQLGVFDEDEDGLALQAARAAKSMHRSHVLQSNSTNHSRGVGKARVCTTAHVSAHTTHLHRLTISYC